MAIFTGTVRDVSSEGLGVVTHPDGMTFFVQGAWPGDEGEFEVIELKKRYGFAKWHRQTQWSQDREDPAKVCVHLGQEAGRCGGCPWMFAKYESQIFYKEKQLRTMLERFHLNTEVLPTLTTEPFGYRNRAQFKTDGKKIGYVTPKTRVLAPIEDCLILNPPTRSLLQHIRSQLPRRDWEPVGRHQWNFFDVNEDLTPEAVAINERQSFKQGNTSANQHMKSWVRETIAGDLKNQRVLELFCGSGNFTEVLKDQYDHIIACELAGRASAALKERAFSQVEVLEADIFARIGWDKIFAKTKSTEILFLDPPREGFKELKSFVEKLVDLKKIIYISCNPQTFITDIRELVIHDGWKLGPVQPVDQFPHTHHVEVMAVLERE